MPIPIVIGTPNTTTSVRRTQMSTRSMVRALLLTP
jgi:hypothetical protein